MPNLPGHRLSKSQAATDRVLPAAGRPGPAPAWPGDHRPSDDESRLWARLWTTPQACAWADTRAHESVARYVRLTCVLEAQLDAGNPQAALAGQVRAAAADLGLSPAGMAALRWAITEAPTTPTTTTPRRRVAAVDTTGL